MKNVTIRVLLIILAFCVGLSTGSYLSRRKTTRIVFEAIDRAREIKEERVEDWTCFFYQCDQCGRAYSDVFIKDTGHIHIEFPCIDCGSDIYYDFEIRKMTMDEFIEDRKDS